MTARKITEDQFSDLWWDEFRHGEGIDSNCILCGNSGRIDTRGKVHNGHGLECGGTALCICPNGRAIKAALARQT